MNRTLPGFRLTLSITLIYLGVLLLIPLAVCLFKAAQLGPAAFWAAVWTARARSAYFLTFSASFTSAAITSLLGLLIAWVLVRYEWPMKRFVDSLVDLPLALPTAVAGLAYSALYVQNGLVWPLPGAARNSRHVLAVGYRAGVDFHRAAVCRASGAAGFGKYGERDRGSRAAVRRKPMADVLARDFTDVKAGADYGLRTFFCSSDWRIRFGRFCFQQQAGRNRNRADADRFQVGTKLLRRSHGDCACVTGDVVCHAGRH